MAMLGLLSMYSLNRLNNYIDASNLMDHSSEVIEHVYDAEISIRDIDRTERGYMLTRDTAYLRLIRMSVDSLKNSVSNLTKDVSTSKEMHIEVDSLKLMAVKRIDALNINIQYVNSSSDTKPSQYFQDSRGVMRACSRILRRIHKYQDSLKVTRFQTEKYYEVKTSKDIKTILIVFVAFTCILFFLLAKELRERLLYQRELQAKVLDLSRSHKELQEIAYVASHDLQEPLRKIQVFSSLLLSKEQTETNKEHLSRINTSAGIMHTLIKDLVMLTSLSKAEEPQTKVDLNTQLTYSIGDLSKLVDEYSIDLRIDKLPVIKAYDYQVRLLFTALLDNAIKFRKINEKALISVSSTIVGGQVLEQINPNLRYKSFYKISFIDNGIGFDNQFGAKIFQIFQTLHGDSYEGRGIGLAMCQRIMANHNGYIVASGKLGEGAVIELYFPLEQA